MEKEFNFICEKCSGHCNLQFNVDYNDVPNEVELKKIIKKMVCPFNFKSKWRLKNV